MAQDNLISTNPLLEPVQTILHLVDIKNTIKQIDTMGKFRSNECHGS